MRLVFDRGTLLVVDPPAQLDVLSRSRWRNRAVAKVMLSLWRARVQAPYTPPLAREAVFTRGAAGGARAQILEQAAAATGRAVAELEASLFADLPAERIVRGPDPVPSPRELALRANELIARSLLARAGEVRIRARELAPLVDEAKRGGLLCSAADGELRVSGPFALFHHTLLYGRALGELLACLQRYGEFDLRADCVLRGQTGELRLTHADPIFTGRPLRRRSTHVRDRLARDFDHPEWELTPSPPPVEAGARLFFPDFRLRRRSDEREWLVEILGFWTPEQVRARMRDNLIVCVDAERACSDGEIADGVRVVRYRRKIDPDELIRAGTR